MVCARPNVKIIACFLVTLAMVTTGRAERLGYHEIKTDNAGLLLPWYSADPGASYDFVIRRIWGFWTNLPNCPNGVPYYLQHQVWKPEHDPRGLGGDQLCMALSSWNLLRQYTGEPAVLANMRLMADFWLEHGVSESTDNWPKMPFPYNTEQHSGRYDGDMRAGKGVLQPDKAGAFGAELMTLYKITGEIRYLKAATGIADVLCAHVQPGDAERSPWPFRVNAKTGAVPALNSSSGNQSIPRNLAAGYTANWTGALRLFDALIQLKSPNTAAYERTRTMVSAWLKKYPLRTNNWGPFFEDIVEYSNTEINADTMAWYILEHPAWDTEGLKLARGLLDWSAGMFGTNAWQKYGVTAIQEQTVYRVPGNSHSSRHASVEIIYADKSGDASRKPAAVRLLSWATYMADEDGKNRYPNDDIWLTDGYGDYVRHYLRAMAAAPELAPADQDHVLGSSSVIKSIRYSPGEVVYETFDLDSTETLRLSFTPSAVTLGSEWL